MPDLRAHLRDFFQGRVCLMGLGNPDHGDDAFGVRLAEQLAAAGVPGVIVAGTTPERSIVHVADDGCDHLVFLDAVDFGGAPGAAALLDAATIAARFPQISTHKLSLGLLAAWATANGATRAWVLGVQPASLQPAAALTPPVQAALEVILELLCDAARPAAPRLASLNP